MLLTLKAECVSIIVSYIIVVTNEAVVMLDFYFKLKFEGGVFGLKKLNLLIFMAGIILLTACKNNNIDAKISTGYAANEIDQPQLMYNGNIFYYWATGFDEKLPEGYIIADTIEHVDNENPPSENFNGARVDTEQEIYYSDSDNTLVYVKYENGYAKFSLEE